MLSPVDSDIIVSQSKDQDFWDWIDGYSVPWKQFFRFRKEPRRVIRADVEGILIKVFRTRQSVTKGGMHYMGCMIKVNHSVSSLHNPKGDATDANFLLYVSHPRALKILSLSEEGDEIRAQAAEAIRIPQIDKEKGVIDGAYFANWDFANITAHYTRRWEDIEPCDKQKMMKKYFSDLRPLMHLRERTREKKMDADIAGEDFEF